MDDKKTQFSCILSSALDGLGYSYCAFRRRIDVHTALADKLNEGLSFHDLNLGKLYIVGSKGEGISLPFQSDIDIMHVLPGILCSDKLKDCAAKVNFQLDQKHQPHGYTKLRLVFSPLEIDGLSEHVVYINGNPYLSNDMLFKITDEGRNILAKVSAIPIKFEPRSGPASPMTVSFGTIDTQGDHVFAFRCTCTYYLDLWCSRKRYQGFPARDLIQRVTTLDAHVVPVGFKLSDENVLQWRICFTLAELCIIQSFNEVQFKVFILLKMLVKCSIQPVCPDITSYVVKNIIFWVFENTPRHLFVESNLTRLLISSVHFLRNCVDLGYIPNYMIPQRNLIIGKVKPDVRSELRKRLNYMMTETIEMVFSCNIIRRGITVLITKPSLNNCIRELLQLIDDMVYAEIKHIDNETMYTNILMNVDYQKYLHSLVKESVCKLTLDPETRDTMNRVCFYFFSIDKELLDTVMSLYQTENNTAAILRVTRDIDMKEYFERLMSNENGPVWYGIERYLRQILPQLSQSFDSIIPLIQCYTDNISDFQMENILPEVVGYFINNTDYMTEVFKIMIENPQALSELCGAAGNNLPLPQVSAQAYQELQKTVLSSMSPEQFQRLSQNETVTKFCIAFFSGQ